MYAVIASFGHIEVRWWQCRKIIQLNNLDKPEIFPNVRSVYRAMRAKNVSVKLYNGIGVSLLYTALSIPLFATALTVIEPITRW